MCKGRSWTTTQCTTSQKVTHQPVMLVTNCSLHPHPRRPPGGWSPGPWGAHQWTTPVLTPGGRAQNLGLWPPRASRTYCQDHRGQVKSKGRLPFTDSQERGQRGHQTSRDKCRQTSSARFLNNKMRKWKHEHWWGPMDQSLRPKILLAVPVTWSSV